MTGWHTQRSLWPLTVIASLGTVLSLQACSGKVQEPSGCGRDSSCGGAIGASGGKGEGGNGAVSGGAQGGADGTLDTCANQVRDSKESDVDCGGTSKCDRCSLNAKCASNNDCETQFCRSGRCADPTCLDKIQNQDETGVDCGGVCSPCDVGQRCSVNEDCSTAPCVKNVCGDHCVNGVKDVDESDKDCGGVTCAPCDDSKGCRSAADCKSTQCLNSRCNAATCSDQLQNQDESDIDCGGVCSTTKGCAVGVRCNSNADCDSYICSKTTSKCLADLVIPPGDVIDDFEDSDLSLPSPALGGRVGTWSPFGDGTGSAIGTVTSTKRGAKNVKALHLKGKDFVSWGSGFGVDLNNSSTSQASAQTYDASAYSGVTFWARAQSLTNLKVRFPNADTHTAGKICSTCDHDYYASIALSTDWQRYTITFSDLTLEPGGVPIPTAFKASGLVSVRFLFPSTTAYEVDIDDVAFVK